jgi:hypothetical protein
VSSIFDRAAPHPVLACVQAIDEALTEAVDLQVGCGSPADRREALLRLTQLESRVAALRMRVMAVSDDVARSEGARDVAALVTHHTRSDFAANRRDLALADSLDGRWHQVDAALSTGEVDLSQARVIVHALDERRHRRPRRRGRTPSGGPPGRAGSPLRSAGAARPRTRGSGPRRARDRGAPRGRAARS